MPELPEVESVRLGILEGFLGKRISTLWTGRLEHLLDPQSLALQGLVGQRLQAVERRGKYLLWRFESLQLLAHLGMSGVWGDSAPRGKHTHVEFHFEDGSWLSYTDPRQFGYLSLHSLSHTLHRWEALGPDALSRAWNAKQLWHLCQRSRLAIKVFLMDQTKVAGIGNIYASEALFRARIHPERCAQELSAEECATLVGEAKAVMRASLKKRGTTFSDYRLTNGKGGGFQKFLQVFQKEGEPCPRCRGRILRLEQGGRSTFFCPGCQG